MKKITLLLLIICLFQANPVLAQTPASPSGTISLDDITENVKKRIQGVIEQQNVIKNQIVAFGKLLSVNNNTLSLGSKNGIKLASTSAQTTFIRLPGSTKISFDDLAIDEFLIIIGADSNQVINATKVVSQKSEPEDGPHTSFFGLITKFDPKTYYLTLENPQTHNQQTFLVGRKSNLYVASPGGSKTKIDRKQDMPTQSPTLVIYTPSTDKTADVVVEEMILNPSSPIITPPELMP